MGRVDREQAFYVDLEEEFGANNYHPLDVVITHGERVWVTDVNGKRYMDMLSAYSALNQGHRHPKIEEAAHRQLERVTLTSRAFRNDQLGPFEKMVSDLTGKELILPMNSGAEAVETALKVARKWGYENKVKKGEDARIITCMSNFHGRTITIVGFSSEDQYREGFGPFTGGFDQIPYGDIDALKRAITPNTVGFLVEPIQGEGGVIIPPEGYLREASEVCRQNNVLLMADEIQTGLGRTGKMFACDHEGVVPDIYILGKALSGGVLPVSAIAANRNVLGVLKPGDHGSTFGGSPLAAAVGMAALGVIIDERLPERAETMGGYFMGKLRRMNSPLVKEVRGKGLLIGVEIKPEYGIARPYCEKLMKLGVLTKETHERVVRFAPPLVINAGEIDWAMERIREVFC